MVISLSTQKNIVQLLVRTLAHPWNPIKNLAGGLLVPLEVADSREVIAAGSSLDIHLRLCDLC